ncbi:DUF817 domain-containing protein [Yoonia sediminilitoris]|uniref:Uncharacterized membrane protein YoaT (DUF817 family) n=1 Tax=Yoonia sediminilitoris TaxID=1286148 RepID=A0A2T6KQ67_9RHOB|nr:DUF817 domain-containing protein [Yoonia sediminilitoris]PUB18698.1 uncharacterized membrane protein YoaT (DUF817 family) [Yoonia sediminilitoris]RCW98866.1 uncharacterized membrane protein YoaT (DUF817 family) [Yoonia sediminilitoris]
MEKTRDTEKHLGAWMRGKLHPAIAEIVMFTLKQGWACLFGGSLLLAIIGTRFIWQSDWPLARYDALVMFAVGLQIVFLRFGLETWAEARVILLFHLTGTAMELFKVSAGSWSYPEAGLLKIYEVPLFSGFMYAAVGSYMARVIRIFNMQFAPFPPLWLHFGLAIAVYVNFFAHHFIWDTRYVLFAMTIAFYIRTRIWFQIGARWYWMPLPLAALLCSLFLWIAENIGTLTGTWVYNGQNPLELVSFAKMGSWYLLLFVAFATVTLVVRAPLRSGRAAPANRAPQRTPRSAPVQSMP